MCLDDGRLMAFIDGELRAEEAAGVERHVQACPECASAVERLRADREIAAQALSSLPPAPAPVVELAPAARAAGTSPRTRRRISPTWRNIAAVLAVAVLLGSLAFSPVRQAAASLLQIFRVKQVKTVSITQADLQSIQSTLESGSGHVDLEAFGEAWVEGTSSEPKTVTLEQAKAALDFPVRLPSTQTAKPVLSLSPSRTVRFKLNVDAVNEALKYYGSSSTLPASLNGKTFSVTVPPILLAQYGDQAAQGLPGDSGTVFVGQARSPELVVPDGVNVAELRDLLINLPFLPENLRDQLAAINDWQSTLIIPNVDGSAHDVNIDGVPAVVYSPESAARSARAKLGPLPDSTTVIWNEDGVVRAVGGPIDEATALDLARSTMK